MMNKKSNYIILPILVILFTIFWSTPCFAWEWLDNAINAAAEAVQDAAETVAAATLGIDTTDNCTVPALISGEDVSSCMFCNMFKVIFNAGSVIAGVAYNTFASDLGKLMVVFMAVSLALIVLKHMATFGGTDAGTIMDEILKKTFVIVAMFLIITQDYYNILNLTIVPIFDTAFELVGLNPGKNAIAEMQEIGSASTMCAEANGIKGFAENATGGNNGGMPQSLGTMIVCAVKSLETKILTLFDFGDWAFCRGLGPDRMFHIIPHPFYLIDGIVLYIGGLLLMIVYPWIMADAVIQLGITFSLLPFAICGYGFEGTKKYLPKLFSWILNTVFIFTFMAILINILIKYIEKIIQEAVVDGAVDPETLFTSPTEGIVFFGGNMIMILFVIYIVYLYVPQIKDLAGEFANGASLSAAGAIDTLLRNQVNKATNKVADYTGKALGEGMRATGNAVNRGARAGARRSMAGIVNVFGHKNADGSMSFSVGGRNAPRALKWLTGNMEFTANRTADGRTALRREFTDIAGNRHVMVSDKYSTVKTTYTKDGRQIQSKTKFKTRQTTDKLFDKYGNINTRALNDLLNSPAAQQNPAYKQAIMEQIAINTLKRNGKNVSTNFSSRNVKFDPNDPSKIYIEQVDHRGKTTRIDMNINMQTGQVAVGMVRDKATSGKFDTGKKGSKATATQEGDREMFFTNGAVTINSTMKVNANGKVYNQVSKVSYSPAVLRGHNNITATGNGYQIISEDGTISSKVNQNHLFFGLNNDTIGNVSEFEKTSEVAVDENGKFIGYVNEDGKIVNKDGTIVGRTDDNGNMIDSSGNVINCSTDKVKGKIVIDGNGKYLGYINEDGIVVNKNGSPGYVTSDGRMIDTFGNEVDCSINNTNVGSKIAVGQNGEFLGYVCADGKIIDKDNNIIGSTNANGQILNTSGAVVGSSIDVNLIKKDGNVVGYTKTGNQADGIAHDFNTGQVMGSVLGGRVFASTGNLFNRSDVVKAFSELRAKKSDYGTTTAFNDIPFGTGMSTLRANTYQDMEQDDTSPGGDGDTPPGGDDDTPPGGDGDTPPSGDGDTPPGGDGDTPPGGDGDTPPGGDGDRPLSDGEKDILDITFGADSGVVDYNSDSFESDINSFLSDPNLGSDPNDKLFSSFMGDGEGEDEKCDHSHEHGNHPEQPSGSKNNGDSENSE